MSWDVLRAGAVNAEEDSGSEKDEEEEAEKDGEVGFAGFRLYPCIDIFAVHSIFFGSVRATR